MNVERAEVSQGVQQYATEVGRRLRDLPAEQRAEIARDITERLTARGISRYNGAVVELGRSSVYADEFRQAMELPPFGRVRRHRLLRVGAVVAVLALVGGGVYAWLHDPVPADYPLHLNGMSVESPGEMVGSVIRMPVEMGQQITFGFGLVNDGDRAVRVDEITTPLQVQAINRGLSFWTESQTPIFQPEIQIVPQTSTVDIVYSGFGVPPSFEFHPFTLQPGEQVLVMLRGSLAYCVEAPGMGTTDHPQLEVTIDGERRTIQGPEMAYQFGDCS